MTDERFKLNPMCDNRANIWYGLYDSKEREYVCDTWKGSEKCCRLLNDLNDENEKLRKAVDNCQFRTLDLLDYIKEKETVTHQEIKDWWNSKVIE